MPNFRKQLLTLWTFQEKLPHYTPRNFWLKKIIIASQIQLLIYLHSSYFEWLGSAYNDVNETVRFKWLLIVIQLHSFWYNLTCIKQDPLYISFTVSWFIHWPRLTLRLGTIIWPENGLGTIPHWDKEQHSSLEFVVNNLVIFDDLGIQVIE